MVRANLFGSPLFGDAPEAQDGVYGDNHILFKNPAYYAAARQSMKNVSTFKWYVSSFSLHCTIISW